MKSLLPHWTLSGMTGACFLLLPLHCRAADCVELRLRIELTERRSTDTNSEAKPRMFPVVCRTDGDIWEMEDDFPGNAHEKWFYDGTNVFESIRATQPMPEETRKTMREKLGLADVPFEVARSNLTIYVWPSPDGHPLGDHVVNLSWLAFCSGDYLKRPGRLIPLPLDMLRHTRDRYGYTDQTVTFPDDNGLPQSVELFTSRALLEASENGFDAEYFFGDRYAKYVKRMVAELPEGVLTFQYKVTESTNFHGRVFPTRFEFFQKGRKFEQNGNWDRSGTGTVESIRECPKPQGVWRPDLSQTVVDYRFHDPAARMDGLVYTSTNSFLAPTNDLALQAKREKHLKRRPDPDADDTEYH